MSNSTNKWHKLASYDTNIQGELHANLLKNNGINISSQGLSSIPGMNSGAVLWVQAADLEKAQKILNSIDASYSNSDSISDIDNDKQDGET